MKRVMSEPQHVAPTALVAAQAHIRLRMLSHNRTAKAKAGHRQTPCKQQNPPGKGFVVSENQYKVIRSTLKGGAFYFAELILDILTTRAAD